MYGVMSGDVFVNYIKEFVQQLDLHYAHGGFVQNKFRTEIILS